jgi:ORF6N domain-containing protein
LGYVPPPGTQSGPQIRGRIVEVRGQRVLLDADLAELYGVPTRRVNEAVRRNPTRFPEDFMFTLTRKELGDLVESSAIASPTLRGGRRTLPRAFSQEGVAMLSSVLHSPRAIAVNVEIMRAFVRLRRIHAEHADLARRLDALELRYDKQFKTVFDAIRALMEPLPAARPRERLDSDRSIRPSRQSRLPFRRWRVP